MGHQVEQNTHLGDPKGIEKEEGAEGIFEEVMAENFPNVVKDMNINKKLNKLLNINKKVKLRVLPQDTFFFQKKILQAGRSISLHTRDSQ